MLSQNHRTLLTNIDRQFGQRPFTEADQPIHWRTSDALIEAGYLECVTGKGVRADSEGRAPLRRTAKPI